MARLRRVLIALAALVLGLVLVAAPAWAYDAAQYPIRSEYAANQTINQATHYTKSWTASPNGVDGVKVGRDFTMRGPGGRTVAAQAAANVSKQTALAWGARALAAGPAIGTALLLWQVYDAVRVRPTDGDAPGVVYDPGVDPSLITVLQFTCSYQGHSSSSSSAQAACEAVRVASEPAAYYQGGYVYTDTDNISVTCTGSGTGTSCTMLTHVYQWNTLYGHTKGNPNGPTPSNVSLSLSTQTTQQNACAGGVPPDFDGKCPTGNYTEALTPEEAAARAWAGPEAAGLTPEQYAQLVNEALGVAPQPVAEDVPMGLGNTVPAFVGPVTTVTNPDGSTVQTAIGWNFQPYGLTKGWGYAASGNFQEVKSVLTKDAQGNVISNETTTTDTDGQTPDDVNEACAEGGDTVLCAEVGQAPDDQVPKSTLNVSFAAEALGLPSACPAPVALWSSHVYSFTPMCDAAGWMRPLVIAVGALVAALMLVAAVRGAS